MFGVLSITVVSAAICILLTSGYVLSITLTFHLQLFGIIFGIIKYFMGFYMEMKENEMYSDNDPRIKSYFWKLV